jgi:transposase-like protein
MHDSVTCGAEYRESDQSWKELLLDCKARGLEIEPHLAIGDGALGFWKTMRQVWDTTKEQRCWVHKMANILDKLPKGGQPKAKAEKAFDLFVKTYPAKYPKATECLEKDKGVLLAFPEQNDARLGARLRATVEIDQLSTVAERPNTVMSANGLTPNARHPRAAY